LPPWPLHPSPQHLRGSLHMRDDSLDLLQGTLDMLVLMALILGPQHGYGVARWIRDTTDGTLEAEEGALYTALHATLLPRVDSRARGTRGGTQRTKDRPAQTPSE